MAGQWLAGGWLASGWLVAGWQRLAGAGWQRLAGAGRGWQRPAGSGRQRPAVAGSGRQRPAVAGSGWQWRAVAGMQWLVTRMRSTRSNRTSELKSLCLSDQILTDRSMEAANLVPLLPPLPSPDRWCGGCPAPRRPEASPCPRAPRGVCPMPRGCSGGCCVAAGSNSGLGQWVATCGERRPLARRRHSYPPPPHGFHGVWAV